MDTSATSDADDIADGDPVYAYKPNLIGSAWAFRLRPDGLMWEYGRRSGTIPYGQIRRVRMAFRPGTMQPYRFLTEVWSPQSPKLQISSTSFRGLMEQTRQDADYVAFVTELHRRMAAADSATRFDAGMHAAMYWLGTVVFGAITVGLFVFLGHTLLKGDLTGGAVIAGLIALVIWQVGTIFYRNRPLNYRPDALPPAVLPRV